MEVWPRFGVANGRSQRGLAQSVAVVPSWSFSLGAVDRDLGDGGVFSL
jgi:hypothetical protein